MKAAVLVVALAVPLASCAVSQRTATAGGTAATYGGDKKAGRLLFAANCSSCHGATGMEGGAVGPSLRHESSRMDFAATVSWIEDPAAPMPKLYPKVLSKSQVRDVAAYVQSL